MKTIYFGKSKGYTKTYPVLGCNMAYCDMCFRYLRVEVFRKHRSVCTGD